MKPENTMISGELTKICDFGPPSTLNFEPHTPNPCEVPPVILHGVVSHCKVTPVILHGVVSGDTTPCRAAGVALHGVVGVALHGVVSPDRTLNRDPIKPEDIMISGELTKICDFGAPEALEREFFIDNLLVRIH